MAQGGVGGEVKPGRAQRGRAKSGRAKSGRAKSGRATGQASSSAAKADQPARTVLVGVDAGQQRQMRAPRQDRFDEAMQAQFFVTLGETSNVMASARAVGVCVQTVYNKRRRDADFALRWEQAKADAMADLEMRALAQGRFGREVVVEERASKDGRAVTRRTRHDEASLTLQRIGGRGALLRIGSEDAEREAEAAAERQARVEAAILLLSDGVREILRAPDHPAGGARG